jgi:hypothetical protein
METGQTVVNAHSLLTERLGLNVFWSEDHYDSALALNIQLSGGDGLGRLGKSQ